MARSREGMYIWDSTMACPNGDMLNDNQPRRDPKTGQLEVSDARMKRFVRDELDIEGYNILVQPTTNEDTGKVMSCATRIAEIAKKAGIKDAAIPKYILDNYFDAKLFGAVMTKPKFDALGCLQIAWSKSVHAADIRFMQGTSAFSSGDNKAQGTIWSKHVTPYALFKTYIVFNSAAAMRQKLNITEEDLDTFTRALIYGLVNYRSTSKNQMPRLYVEVIYKKHRVDGELDYIDITYDAPDLELRNISQFKFDFSRLVEYCERKKEYIDEVRLYRHSSVRLDSIPSGFHVIEI